MKYIFGLIACVLGFIAGGLWYNYLHTNGGEVLLVSCGFVLLSAGFMFVAIREGGR